MASPFGSSPWISLEQVARHQSSKDPIFLTSHSTKRISEEIIRLFTPLVVTHKVLRNRSLG